MLDIIKRIGQVVSQAVAQVKRTVQWTSNTYTPQVHAALSPYSSCFSHCSAWFLQSFGVACTPDDVTRTLNSGQYNAWVDAYIGRGVSAQYAGRMQTLWQLQERYLNDRLAAYSVRAVFTTGTTDAQILDWIQTGPVIVGTSPVYNGQTLGHIMLVVGADIGAGEYTVDDPFGDWRTGYRDASGAENHENGNDLRVTFGDFGRVRGGLSIHAEAK